jgi:hypothetical protein
MPPKSKKIVINVQPKEEKKTKGRKSKLMDQFSPEARLSEQMRQAKERYAILKPDIPAQTTVYCTCDYLIQRKWGPTIPQDEAHQHQAVGFCETCKHYISSTEKPKSNVPVVMIID